MSTTADAILAALVPAIDGIAATFGPACEVVLHDYRHPEHSVVAVAGSVTGRTVGSGMSPLGRRMRARGDDAVNDVNYRTKTDNGRVLKCSTLPLRDADGTLIGALCINIDVTELQRAGEFIAELAGAETTDFLPVTTFSNDFVDIVDSIIGGEERSRAKAAAAWSRQERREVIIRLIDHAVFDVRGAVPRVAARLGISRAALYTDLAAVRDDPDGADSSRSRAQ